MEVSQLVVKQMGNGKVRERAGIKASRLKEYSTFRKL
jgi:hypothetical protein